MVFGGTMAAEKGNKYALGNSGPPSQYDLKAIAKDLVEWSESPDALKFTMFGGPRRLNIQRFSEWCEKDEVFAEAYSIAKMNLDINRFNAAKNNQMPESWYAKNESVYDPINHKHYRDEKKFESNLRKEEEGQRKSTYNILISHDLTAGIDLSTSPISTEDNPSPQ